MSPRSGVEDELLGKEIHINEANNGFNQKLSMSLYSVIFVFSFTLLTTLISYDVINMDTLSNPDSSGTQKALFMLVAVPMGVLASVMGMTVLAFLMSTVKRFLDNRKLELFMIAALGLTIIIFLWYVNKKRRLQDDPIIGEQREAPRASYAKWVWETVKLPYRTVLEGILFLIQNVIWILFGLTSWQWLNKHRVTIGHLIFLGTLMYVYYYLSFML